MPGLRLDAGGWGQKGGSCAKGKTIKFILRAKEVAETLCLHPVTPAPHGWSICVLFLCLFHPGLGGGSAPPPHLQPFPALLSSASFDPFVKRLLEASEPLATLATSSEGLGLAC